MDRGAARLPLAALEPFQTPGCRGTGTGRQGRVLKPWAFVAHGERSR